MNDTHQTAFVYAGGVGVLCDLFVQHRLREEWLVDLVVSHAAVADHIDDAVLSELIDRGKGTRREKRGKKHNRSFTPSTIRAVAATAATTNSAT